MTDIAIHVEDLSKQYELGREKEAGATLRDVIARRVASATHTVTSRLRHSDEAQKRRKRLIWALRGVSFDVERGELIGIIGRNGAGKTTLLKILSRITEPTSGRAKVTGRVGSLLEASTGFHPELTGRENIYLSGSILGMRRAEIDRRFEEIVDFAGIERFLDTPVKRYSSGMGVRLGFAVAAHLEPEILLVDEVLAVGDLAFQKKCLGKMGDVARAGRTVVFVSHNMAVIQALCERGIFILNGRVHTDAPIEEAVAAYLRTLESSLAEDLSERKDRRGRKEITIERIEISGVDGMTTLATGAPARFVFMTTGLHRSMSCRFTIFNRLGHPVAELDSGVPGPNDRLDDALEEGIVCEVDELPLLPGRYRVDVELRARGVRQDGLEMAAVFDVEEGTLQGRPVATEPRVGDITLPHRWTLPAG